MPPGTNRNGDAGRIYGHRPYDPRVDDEGQWITGEPDEVRAYPVALLIAALVMLSIANTVLVLMIANALGLLK